MSYTLVIAEKPSVARDIARVLKAAERGEGYLAGGAYRVTWAIGHLVTLKEPEEIDARLKKWRAADLPILPAEIPLKVLPKTKPQYSAIKRLMNDGECERIICATDAGREGELIFRYIYRMTGCKKPVSRLWISSMTDEAIREGFASLKPSSHYDSLYESARCRSEADWLVGMNASRAFTLRYDALLSVGRVQTPTLALLVRRHLEIASFVPKEYWTILADFDGYTGLWLNEETREKRVYDAERADAIAKKVRGKRGVVESALREPKKEWPPYLYDLTSLQRDANRMLGFTAQKTLTVAQKLYEEHKLITYPRTDSQQLPRDMAARTRAAMLALPEAYAAHSAPLLAHAALPMPSRIFDDTKISDHHAIIPTGKKANMDALSADEKALFDIIARRLLAAFYPDHLYDIVRVLTRVEGEPFESLGREIRQIGWKAVYADLPSRRDSKKKDDEDGQALPPLTEGEARTAVKTRVKAEKTKPPAPHTDASILSAMERAGRDLPDEALRESMKKGGLGTPATRAAIIERLLAVGYAKRVGRSLQATEKGVRLIAVVPEDIASPETTGRWEKALSDIVTGEMTPERFLSGIQKLAASLVQSAESAPKDIVFEKEERRGGKAKGLKSLGTCPLCGKGSVLENTKAFYCSRWKEGCALTVWKDCCVKASGPVLTGALMERALRDGRVVGRSGTLVHEKGIMRFEGKQGKQ